MARRYYNGTVRNLNIRIQSFPDVLVARPLGFIEQPFFELDDPAAAAVPKVDLTEILTMTLRTIAGALWLLVAALTPAAAQERILSFVSDARVERNGDLFVTETIRVQAEGREIRRGILRDFPTIYARRDGTRVEVGFAVQSVTRDGAIEILCHRAAAERRARAHRPCRQSPCQGPAYLCDQLSHDPADRLLSVIRRALLERDRHRLDLRHRRRGSAHQAPGGRAVWPVRGLYGAAGGDGQGRHGGRAATGPDRLSHHPTAAGPQRPDRRRRLAERHRHRARRGPADDVVAAGQSADGRGRRRAPSPARLLHDRLASWSAAIRAAAPSFRCSPRRTGCRPPPCATCRRWGSTIAPSPPPFSISACAAI